MRRRPLKAITAVTVIIVMSVSNEGKKTDEPGNAFVVLMSCNRERAGFKIHPTQVALRQVRSSLKPDVVS
jgi:hypothetical protein